MRILSTPSLGITGSHEVAKYEGLGGKLELSTPSLGITREVLNCLSSREWGLLSTPSLGITRGEVSGGGGGTYLSTPSLGITGTRGLPQPGRRPRFQLPLSGSLDVNIV